MAEADALRDPGVPVPALKSVEFSSESVHPPAARRTAKVFEPAGAAAEPSKQFTYATPVVLQPKINEGPTLAGAVIIPKVQLSVHLEGSGAFAAQRR